ncbi:hypothetical protein LCGC14_0911550 [marine sediment metagenome]|uniref:Uncharacterized protein n=1 Tax=marine sediment metagenome TaxID=412755 RepID=A0A0F9S0D7_9ZZZZ
MSFRPFRKEKRVKISVRTGLASSELIPIITTKRKKKVFQPKMNLDEVYSYLRCDKSTGGTSG